MFDAFGGGTFDLPVTNYLSERVLSLPMHSELEKDQLTCITGKLLEFINH
jgi:dTDP-4-amino-4,6-dideoxygalactose transaminase